MGIVHCCHHMYSEVPDQVTERDIEHLFFRAYDFQTHSTQLQDNHADLEEPFGVATAKPTTFKTTTADNPIVIPDSGSDTESFKSTEENDPTANARLDVIECLTWAMNLEFREDVDPKMIEGMKRNAENLTEDDRQTFYDCLCNYMTQHAIWKDMGRFTPLLSEATHETLALVTEEIHLLYGRIKNNPKSLFFDMECEKNDFLCAYNAWKAYVPKAKRQKWSPDMEQAIHRSLESFDYEHEPMTPSERFERDTNRAIRNSCDGKNPIKEPELVLRMHHTFAYQIFPVLKDNADGKLMFEEGRVCVYVCNHYGGHWRCLVPDFSNGGVFEGTYGLFDVPKDGLCLPSATAVICGQTFEEFKHAYPAFLHKLHSCAKSDKPQDYQRYFENYVLAEKQKCVSCKLDYDKEFQYWLEYERNGDVARLDGLIADFKNLLDTKDFMSYDSVSGIYFNYMQYIDHVYAEQKKLPVPCVYQAQFDDEAFKAYVL